MLNFSLSSLFQRHFCHSGNNSGHTHVVPVPSAGIELPGQASERLGKCLLLVWLRLQASVWDPSTLGCPPFMDTFGHNAWGWNGPWIHRGRRHVNIKICDRCTKKTWFGLEDDTCQSGMLTALAARAGRLLSRDTSNSLESPQHLQNTINATISFLPSMLSFKVKCINQFLLQLSVNFAIS